MAVDPAVITRNLLAISSGDLETLARTTTQFAESFAVDLDDGAGVVPSGPRSESADEPEPRMLHSAVGIRR